MKSLITKIYAFAAIIACTFSSLALADQVTLDWSGSYSTNWSTALEINPNSFTGVTSGSKLAISYNQGVSGSGIKIISTLGESWWSPIQFAEAGTEGWLAFNSTSGSITVTLTQEILATIKEHITATDGPRPIKILGNNDGCVITQVKLLDESGNITPEGPITWNEETDRWKAASTGAAINSIDDINDQTWYILGYTTGNSDTTYVYNDNNEVGLTNERPKNNWVAYSWKPFLISFKNKNTNNGWTTFNCPTPLNMYFCSSMSNGESLAYDAWDGQTISFYGTDNNGFALTVLNSNFSWGGRCHVVEENAFVKKDITSVNYRPNGGHWFLFPVSLSNKGQQVTSLLEETHLSGNTPTYIPIDNIKNAASGSTLSIVYKATNNGQMSLKYNTGDDEIAKITSLTIGTGSMDVVLTDEILNRIKSDNQPLRLYGQDYIVVSVYVTPAGGVEINPETGTVVESNNYRVASTKPTIYSEFYPDGVRVSIYSKDNDVYYTLDGTEPTASSAKISAVNGVAYEQLNSVVVFKNQTAAEQDYAHHIYYKLEQPLLKNHTYRVELDARTSHSGDFTLPLRPTAGTTGACLYLQTNPKLSQSWEWTHCSWEWTSDRYYTTLQWFIGKLAGNLDFKNVSLYDVTESKYIFQYANNALWESDVEMKITPVGTIKARCMVNGNLGETVTYTPQTLGTNQMAYTINGPCSYTQEFVLAPWIITNTPYNPGPDFTCKGVSMSSFNGSVTFGFRPDTGKFSFTPKKVIFWINKKDTDNGSYSYTVSQNNNNKVTGNNNKPQRNSEGWTEVVAELKNWPASSTTDGQYVTVTIETKNLTNEYYGLGHITIVGEYSDDRTVSNIHADNATITAEDHGKKTVTYTTSSDAKVSASASVSSALGYKDVVIFKHDEENKQLNFTAFNEASTTITLIQEGNKNYKPGFHQFTLTAESKIECTPQGNNLYQNFTSGTLPSWIEYTGNTQYSSKKATDHIEAENEKTVRKTNDDVKYAVVNTSNSLTLNVAGANSVSLYVLGGESGNQISIVDEDGNITITTVNANTSSMVFVNLPSNNYHTLTISDELGNAFEIYAVRTSEKKTPELQVLSNKEITVGGDNWVPTANTDYVCASSATWDLSSSTYAQTVNNEIVAISTGYTYVNINAAETNEFRALTRSIKLSTKRVELAVNSSSTWALNTLTTNDNDGEWNHLYWETASGICQDTKSNVVESGTNGLIGLKSNSSSKVHFNLPENNNGGILSVTVGPRYSANQNTKISVNGANPQTSYYDGSEDHSSKATQFSWTIAPNTEKIEITKADASDAEGVITSITWVPAPVGGSAHYTLPADATPSGYEISSGAVLQEIGDNWGYGLSGNVWAIWSGTSFDFNLPESAVGNTEIIVKAICGNGAPTTLSIIDASNDCIYSDTISSYSQYTNFVFSATESSYTFANSNKGNAIYLTIEIISSNKEIGYTRKQTPGVLNTICLPYSVKAGDYSGAQFYKIEGKRGTNFSNSIVYFTKVDDLEAGMPYLVYPLEGEMTVCFTKETDDDISLEPKSSNGLYGSYDRFIFGEHDWAQNKYYVINSNSRIQCGSAKSGVVANRAYIMFNDIPQLNQAPAQRLAMSQDGFSFEEDEEESQTAIEEIETNSSDYNCYTISGYHTSANETGLMIVGGKKVIKR